MGWGEKGGVLGEWCSGGPSLRLGRGQHAIGVPPLQMVSSPTSTSSGSTSGVDGNKPLLFVSTFVPHPTGRVLNFSTKAKCIIADDRILSVKHLGLNLGLALLFFSPPTLASGHSLEYGWLCLVSAGSVLRLLLWGPFPPLAYFLAAAPHHPALQPQWLP